MKKMAERIKIRNLQGIEIWKVSLYIHGTYYDLPGSFIKRDAELRATMLRKTLETLLQDLKDNLCSEL